MASPEPNSNEAVLAALLGAVSYSALSKERPLEPSLALDSVGTIWTSLLGSLTNLHRRALNARAGELPTDLGEYHRDRESTWHRYFIERSEARMLRDLPSIMALPAQQQVRRLREVIAREKHFSRLHLEAFERRLTRITEHVSLRMDDPRDDATGGAYWTVDWGRKTHTEDCLIMHGKSWSWRVLRLIHPANRHAFCGCTLHSSEFPPIDVFPPDVPVGFDIGFIPSARRDVLGPVSAADLIGSI